MYPTIMPGDRVIVKPLPKGELPKPGTVVVYLENTRLVMHRLVKITCIESDKAVFISRGDSLKDYDRPWHQDQLTGIAVMYKRGVKEHSIPTFLPGLLTQLAGVDYLLKKV